MSQPQPPGDYEQPSSRGPLQTFLALAALAAAAFVYLYFRPHGTPEGEGETHPAVGMRLAAVRLQSIDVPAQMIGPADLVDRVVVLNFWGTWCPPCVEELPHVAQLAQKYAEIEDIRLYAVSCGDESPEKFDTLRTQTIEFLRQRQLDLATYADTSMETRQAAEMIGAMNGYPTTIVLDRKGNIRGVWNGYMRGIERDIARLVDRLVAEES